MLVHFEKRKKSEYVMSKLLKNIYSLLDEAIESECNSLGIYTRLIEAYEGLLNEKFADVAGLNRPNFGISMIDKKNLIDELKKIKFAVELRIADKDKLESKDEEKKWKEATGKIPQKDVFTLEGIDTWYISHNEMIPDHGHTHSPLFREEARKLVASGFNLGFNFPMELVIFLSTIVD